MTSNEYIAMEHTAHRILSGVRNLCGNELLANINRIESVLSEVRQYAVAVNDIREMKMGNDERIALIKEAEDRLLRFLAPTRL